MQAQADEMRDGFAWQLETNLGSPVMAVLTTVVYVAQKTFAKVDDARTCRRQLSWLHLASVVVLVGLDVKVLLVGSELVVLVDELAPSLP
jgi:hypothetical protein